MMLSGKQRERIENMITIPEIFQAAIASYEESERERLYWERERNLKRVSYLVRELKGLGLEVSGNFDFPVITIEGIEFMLTGNENDGFEVSAKVWTWEDGQVWLRIYGLARLGEVVKEHFE